MALVHAARREEHRVGNYTITIFYDEKGEPIGALVEGPRLPRPVYIARMETAAPKIPKQVRRFLRRHGFNVQV